MRQCSIVGGLIRKIAKEISFRIFFLSPELFLFVASTASACPMEGSLRASRTLLLGGAAAAINKTEQLSAAAPSICFMLRFPGSAGTTLGRPVQGDGAAGGAAAIEKWRGWRPVASPEMREKRSGARLKESIRATMNRVHGSRLPLPRPPLSAVESPSPELAGRIRLTQGRPFELQPTGESGSL
jgi:hypothetical protein